jgi:4'-phosphopantetheinyl transferase
MISRKRRRAMDTGWGGNGRARERHTESAERLAPDRVHVWKVGLDLPEETTSALRRVLSPDERARADRFHFARDRARYTVAHAALRRVLARYVAAPAGGLRFTTNEYGKPALAGEAAARDVRFNLSHSHALAVVAVTSGREVGVDVERVRPDVECMEIAGHYFSARESASLASLPASLRVQGFFACWTRKEAYIKATGLGLSQALDRFDVSLEPGPGAALLGCADDPTAATRWTMRDLEPAPGYAGALVVEGSDWDLEVREY